MCFFILNCEIYLNSGGFWADFLSWRPIFGIFADENGRDVAIAGWRTLHEGTGVAIAGHLALHGCADVAIEGWRVLHGCADVANEGHRMLGNV